MLQQKWFSYTKDPTDDIATHVSKIEDMCFTLKALKENVPDGFTKLQNF